MKRFILGLISVYLAFAIYVVVLVIIGACTTTYDEDSSRIVVDSKGLRLWNRIFDVTNDTEIVVHVDGKTSEWIYLYNVTGRIQIVTGKETYLLDGDSVKVYGEEELCNTLFHHVKGIRTRFWQNEYAIYAYGDGFNNVVTTNADTNVQHTLKLKVNGACCVCLLTNWYEKL